MAPAHADALRSMRRVYLDAGTRDEYFLDLGATGFGRSSTSAGASTRSSRSTAPMAASAWRYPGAIRELVLALT